MAHGHRLKIQNLVIDDVDLSTLAARTALAINSQFATISNTFLIKRIKYMLQASPAILADGPIAVCVVKGDATTAEINAALTEFNSKGPDDTTQVLTEDEVWTIIQKSVRMMTTKTTSDANTSKLELVADFKLPGNGIPAVESQGVNVFAVNLGNNALSTGIIVSGIVQLWGVWLRD